MNVQANKIKDDKAGKRWGKRSKAGFGSAMQQVLGGNFLKRESTLRLLPFLLFLTLIIMFYIANTYHAEKKEREIQALRKSLKELRYEYITTRSELMNHSQQSEVARRLKAINIKESRVPPVKVIKNTENDKADHD
ncbi:MAG: FtsL-like putative cell division protein [Bacteroidales bacterium]|nr:FtsL-like putative cell division protein [Bacteroidales bacterium]